MGFPEMRPSRGTGKAAPRPAQGRASVVLVWRNAMRKRRKTCFPGAAGSSFLVAVLLLCLFMAV